MILADAAVEVGVGEVVGFEDFASVDGGAYKRGFLRRDEVGQVGNDLVGAVAVDAFVVVAGEEGAAVNAPEFVLDRHDARGALTGFLFCDPGDDVQPGHDGPQAVFFADVVAPRAEAFFAADRHFLGVEEVAEEFPAGGDLVVLKALFFGDEVDGSRSGHAASETVDALLLEIGNQLGVVCDDGQAVSWRDESVGTVDHVAIAIAVTSSTELDLVLINGLDERMGVHQVGVRVAPAKIRGWYAILCTAAR